MCDSTIWDEILHNAQPTSEKHQNNFQKVKKSKILTQEIVKNAIKEGQKLTLNFDFRDHRLIF